ncbi:hypothetical protein FRX31_033721 [Thalictrum thalictroides]|uniref:Uncharacterized protein n=1 Tax=Thalictrum thalictroides TaxID=46969 RepID=A0A7J6UVS1_THATH|nr:hypothetical protein FRX31_033721 [Thalictrum thalictroides]
MSFSEGNNIVEAMRNEILDLNNNEGWGYYDHDLTLPKFTARKKVLGVRFRPEFIETKAATCHI